jgi:hypothetical protein
VPTVKATMTGKRANPSNAQSCESVTVFWSVWFPICLTSAAVVDDDTIGLEQGQHIGQGLTGRLISWWLTPSGAGVSLWR